MQDIPGPAQIRARIRGLAALEKKVLGGMIVLMIKNHEKVRDVEWVAEHFTRVAVVAHGFSEDGDVDEDVDEVQRFVQLSMSPVLDVAFPLFAQVAADLNESRGPGKFTIDEACEHAMGYFA